MKSYLINIRTTSILVFLLYFNTLHSQNAPGVFYEFVSNYRVLNPNNVDSSGESDYVQKISDIWNQRLYPHGDFRITANSLWNYVNAFNQSSPCSNINTSHWEALGPNEKPIDKNSGGAEGVGRVHRVVYDPHYNLVDPNLQGSINKIVYACSAYGGLWRSNNNGTNWNVLNTDFFPFSSIGDIAIDYNDSKNLFVTTGDPDGGVTHNFDPNWSGINPYFTFGVYRSTDFGITFQPINSGLLTNFQAGGVIRDISINPSNSNELFIASSSGIFKTTNALALNPQWTQINAGLSLPDYDFRSIEFDPSVPNCTTLYTSGHDIYKTINSGATWFSLTGSTTGLDLSNLVSLGIQYHVERISISLANSNSDYLYAYIVANSSNGTRKSFVYQYRNSTSTWIQVYNFFGSISPDRMPIAVSLQDPFSVFIGSSQLSANRIINSSNLWFNYSGSLGIHADVHGLAFEPNTSNPNLMIATDGGVSYADISGTFISFSYKYSGLQLQTIWSFDVDVHNKNSFAIANQDAGIDIFKKNNLGFEWWALSDGDGYTSRFLDHNTQKIIGLYGISGNISHFDYSTGNKSADFKPIDPSTNIDAYIPKTFPVTIDYATNNTYVGFSNIFERINPAPQQGNWKVESDMGKPPAMYQDWERQITEIAVSKSDPNYIYIVTGGVDIGPVSSLAPKFFRSTTGGNDGNYSLNKFTELTQFLPHTGTGNLFTPVITGIAVSPTNPLKIWMTFTGDDPNIKVQVSNDGGLTWQSDDLAGVLSYIPVNSIVYQDGTDDRLYIGTDAGVYYKDNSTNCWVKMGDIPNVRVTELKISLCEGRLYAATFGRGLWGTDLLSYEKFNSELEVSQDATWSGNKYMDRNIRITSGTTLIISGTTFMPEKSSIFVEPNARLIIDGGKIFNNCDKFWNGIQITGSKTDNQHPLNQPLHQGLVKIINGGTIENAREAISLWDGIDYNTSGGIIITDNAVFRNNRRAVAFMSYHNHSVNSPTTLTSNLSSFKNTDFIIDDSYPGVNDFFAHVTLWDVEGVKFSGCRFSNIQSNVNYSTSNNKGIYSIDAGYVVNAYCTSTLPPGTPCPSQNLIMSTFEGFNWGIHATGSSLSSNTVKIDQSEFNKNYAGVEISSVNNSSITRTNFEIGNSLIQNPPLNNGIGLILRRSSGFRIEENNFNLGSPLIANNTFGIRTLNSGEQNNEIYRNNFTGLGTSNFAFGRNRNPMLNYFGLQYLCNNNSLIGNFDFDIQQNTFDQLGSGINTFQGSIFPGLPAGNIYTNSGNNIDSDFRNITVNPTIVLHTNNNAQPIFFTPNLVIPSSSTNLNSCPSKLLSFPVSNPTQQEIEDIKNESLLSNSTYLNFLYAYNQLMDGGNTNYLVNQIQLTWSPEALDLRDELISISPFVSEEALREAFNRNILPQAIILELCLANPSATRNDGFIRYLTEEITPPLPSSMIELIISNWEEVSLRDALESSLAASKTNFTYSSNYLLNQLLTSEILTTDSVLTPIYNSRRDLEDSYSLISLLLKRNLYDQAINFADSLIITLEQDEVELQEVYQYKEYITFLNDIYEQGISIANLNEGQINQLVALRDNSYSRMSTIANNILCFFYSICVEDEEINNLNLRFISSNNNKKSIINNLKVIPNPANGMVKIHWNLESFLDKAELVIIDMFGKQINKTELIESTGELFLDVSTKPNGVYTVLIYNNNLGICKEKLFVIH
jgi:hypothetical protein